MDIVIILSIVNSQSLLGEQMWFEFRDKDNNDSCLCKLSWPFCKHLIEKQIFIIIIINSPLINICGMIS